MQHTQFMAILHENNLIQALSLLVLSVDSHYFTATVWMSLHAANGSLSVYLNLYILVRTNECKQSCVRCSVYVQTHADSNCDYYCNSLWTKYPWDLNENIREFAKLSCNCIGSVCLSIPSRILSTTNRIVYANILVRYGQNIHVWNIKRLQNIFWVVHMFVGFNWWGFLRISLSEMFSEIGFWTFLTLAKW